MKTYVIKFTRSQMSSIMTTTITASSESQAKEQLKSRYNGDVSIVSCVER